MSKKIKLQTISEKAKRKKDFILIISIIVVLGLLVLGLAQTALKTQKEKTFQKQQSEISKPEIELTPAKSFKETWALSIENAIKNQNDTMKEFIKMTTNELNKSRTEMSNMVIDSIANQKKMIDLMKDNQEKQFKMIEKTLDGKINNIQKEISELKAKNKNIDHIDLIPKEKKPHKKPKDSDGLSLDDIIEENLKNEKKEIKITTTDHINTPTKITSKPNSSNTEILSYSNTITSHTDQTNKGITEKEKAAGAINESRKKLAIVDIDTSEAINIVKKEQERVKKILKKKKKKASYHVMIGLSKATMITGVYAPAFSQGDEEPLPVLLQAEGDILIPNDDYESVDGCFLIGTAKGNMNSKTADIRLISISCSLDDGKKMIEGPVHGWVIGENGIPGVQGELLHKNGAWLSKTFVAGFLQTFADSFSKVNNNNYSTGTNGLNIGQATKTSVAGGASTIFNKLGSYYLKMAEQIFPVIEVKGGRTVNILLKGGEDLMLKDFNKIDTPSIDNTFYEDRNDEEVNTEVLGYVTSKEKKKISKPNKDINKKSLIKPTNDDKISTNPFEGLGE